MRRESRRMSNYETAGLMTPSSLIIAHHRSSSLIITKGGRDPFSSIYILRHRGSRPPWLDPVTSPSRSIDDVTDRGLGSGGAVTPFRPYIYRHRGPYGCIRLWNPITGEHLRTIETFHERSNRRCYNVSCENTKPLCAVASSCGLGVWDLTSEEDRPQYTFRGRDLGNSRVSWSPDDSILLADHVICDHVIINHRYDTVLWNYAHDATYQKLELKHPEPEKNQFCSVRCIFSKDGLSVICGWNWGDITFWDLRSGSTTRELKRHENCISTLALPRDGRLLASSCQEFKICIWTVASGECAHELCGHSSYVYGLAFTNDGTGPYPAVTTGESYCGMPQPAHL